MRAVMERTSADLAGGGPVAGRLGAGGFAAWLAVAALAGVGGLVTGLLAPRGPVTTGQALAVMASGLGIGMVAGLATGRVWALLVTGIAYVIAFELARIGASGPTVDGIRLGSVYGVIALVAGRGFHAALLLPPLLLGTVLGVWAGGRMGRPAAAFGTVGLGFAVAVLAVAVVRPAATPPILGPDGEPVPGSVAELATVEIGGPDQVLLIRGSSDENPVLLHLAGGPGGTDLGAMRADTGLEQDFVVVVWDQRGTGKSYPTFEPLSALTLERMVDDAVEVVDHLRHRFGQDRIYLTGNSWGTILGALVVQRSPERFHAYVGTGQMVSPVETDVMFWEDTLAWADATGDQGLAATLRANGPPPYDDPLDYEAAVGHEHDWNVYPEFDGGGEMPFNTFVPENTLLDRVNAMRGFLDGFATLYPQIQGVDLRRDAATLDVPVYLVVGEHEARGRAVLADEWFERLDAPAKERVVFDGTGHRPSFEDPAAFAALMRRVLAETG